MSDAIPCPQWGAPAESTMRFWLDSTDGPIQHPKIGCLSKHWFTPRPETVQPEQVATRSAPGGATKLTGPVLPAVQASRVVSLVAEQMAGGHTDVPAL